MSDYKLVGTTSDVFTAIFKAHREKLCVYSSYSNPSGDCYLGHGYPEMETTWGFNDADYPLIKHVMKEREPGNPENFYWLCLPQRETEGQK